MESIHDSFEKCNRLFIEATESSHDESFIKDAIVTLGSCLQRVEAADLYSKGEELEEYSTQSLKVRHLCWRVIFAILANSTRIGCILFNIIILVCPIVMHDCFQHYTTSMHFCCTICWSKTVAHSEDLHSITETIFINICMTAEAAVCLN